MHVQIFTAFSHSRKTGLYTFAAYVAESAHEGLPKSHAFKVLHNVATGEDMDATRDEVLAKIHSGNERHPKDAPVTDVGKRARDVVLGLSF